MVASEPPKGSAQAERYFFGGGEVGTLARAFDWAASPLGDVATWPHSLRAIVSTILATRHPMYLIWGKQHIQFYNDAYSPILGPRRHPLALGRSVTETEPDLWLLLARPLAEVLATGRATSAEHQFVPVERHGITEERYYSFSYSPVRDDDGAACGLLAVLNETTTEVIGNRRLRTLNTLAARIADAQSTEDACARAMDALRLQPLDIPFALAYLLNSGDSEAYLTAITGLSRGTAASPTTIALAEPDARDLWQIAQVAAGNEMREITIDERFGKLPGLPWMEPARGALVLPLQPLNAAHPLGVLVLGLSPRLPFDAPYLTYLRLVAEQMAQGIATVRHHQATLARAEHESQLHALAETNRRMSEFLGIASHELRTPLTSITANVQMAESTLRRYLPVAGAADETNRRLVQAHMLLGRVDQQVERLNRLVGEMLDIARIEGDRMQLQMQQCDLISIIADAVQEQQMNHPEREITCILPDEPVLVLGDAARLGQVVTNFVTNALRYSVEEEPVSVRLRAQDARVRVEIHDRGQGIPRAEQSQIWERFYRVPGIEALSGSGVGLGLGLFINRTIIARHGGKVGVESTPGAGSTFWFELPLPDGD